MKDQNYHPYKMMPLPGDKWKVHLPVDPAPVL
jgi:hypothetical protein